MTYKKLITSALPYVNNAPHLGNIIGCVLSADAYARYCRAQEYETLYICATDEYGTATENKARSEGLTPKEICDKFHVIHKRIYEYFNISFDFFGRTSYPEHTEVTQMIYHDLDKQGMIEEQETEQTYCEYDNMFLADRYVLGTCPGCGFDDARGDQCDKCGKLLQPTEVINPKCQICGKTPTRQLTKHLYVKLPELEEKLRSFHQTSMERGQWSNNAITLTKGWMETGLMARPITRDLSWGIPVPREGYENKVFYVWFDAPIGYISNTKRYLPDSWKEWWMNPEGTQLYQFMAKDNIPFHTVVFPACLLGTNKNWTLLHHINATEYLNYENDKFSKSRNTGVFGTDVLQSDIPVDLWRFYLLFNRPEKADSNFSWDSFFEDVNSNFIDNIGNLLNRVLVFYNKHFGDTIDQVSFSDRQSAFLSETKKAGEEIIEHLENVRIKDGIKGILALGREGNRFFQEEEPWATVKTAPETAKASLTALIFLLRDIGIMLSPYMPETAERMLTMLGNSEIKCRLIGKWDDLKGKQLGKPQILFNKIPKQKIEEYRQRYSGINNRADDEKTTWPLLALTVGTIKSVSSHPSADLLYVEEIDCGEPSPRTIVSGLVKHYQPEELLGKQVLVVSNLTPTEIRGVTSHGMLLTAETRKKMEVIEVPHGKPGDCLVQEGETSHQPAAEVTIDQFKNAGLKVVNHTLMAEEKALVLGGKQIHTQKIQNGKVR